MKKGRNDKDLTKVILEVQLENENKSRVKVMSLSTGVSCWVNRSSVGLTQVKGNKYELEITKQEAIDKGLY